jgi:two-component system sensor histidine kinase ResE
VTDVDGHVTHWVAIHRDITDRKLAEQERARHLDLVQAAEAHYRTLFEGMADAALVIDPSGRILDANPAAIELLRYSRDELIDLELTAFIPNQRTMLISALRQLRAAGSWRGETEVRRVDGVTLTVEARVTATHLPNGAVYIAVLRDISERRAVERMQRDFITVVSHELLSPLTTLKAVSELLNERGVARKRAVEAIARQVRRLERLAGDVLDVARLESGQLTLQRSTIDLTEIARCATAQARVLEPNCVLELHVPPEPCWGHWDYDRIEQVVQNLLSNAIKYSPDGGKIEVRLERVGGFACIQVADHGVGIAPEALPHLFDRFYRADRGEDSRAQGVGLGLYIANWIVQAHGGQMAVESILGHGSTFSFILPLGVPSEAATSG